MIMGEGAQSLTRRAVASLTAAGIDNARLDARLLMRHAAGLAPEQLLADPDRALSDEEERRFLELVDRRAAREPLSHILGHREFWSLDFEVSSAVLDPRPDSETLIEAVLAHVTASGPRNGADLSILDLGTGSGCLLLTLLHELPQAIGTGVDISPEALAVATSNAERLGLTSRARFVESDWTDALSQKFDVIVSNPPYIRHADIAHLAAEVRDHEPALALDGGPNGLDAYRRIVPALGHLFGGDSGRPGLAAFEVGEGQAGDVSNLLLENGFSDVKKHRDLAGIERCVSGLYAF
jgi:release factor glutamine methyltransferase